MSDIPPWARIMHVDSFGNRAAIELFTYAGCFSCLAIFPVSEISEWADGQQTPICPKCGIDAVLPGNVPVDTLGYMRHWYFERDDPTRTRPPAEKAP